MNSMNTIVEELKTILFLDVAEKEGKGRKIKDKELASELGIDPSILAVSKSRGKILYEEIAQFCAKRSISINTLLFSQSAESLIKNTSKYELYKYLLIH